MMQPQTVTLREVCLLIGDRTRKSKEVALDTSDAGENDRDFPSRWWNLERKVMGEPEGVRTAGCSTFFSQNRTNGVLVP